MACEGTNNKLVPEGLYPMKGTHTGTVLKNYSPLETDCLICIIPWNGPHTVAREKCREEGGAARVMN